MKQKITFLFLLLALAGFVKADDCELNVNDFTLRDGQSITFSNGDIIPTIKLGISDLPEGITLIWNVDNVDKAITIGSAGSGINEIPPFRAMNTSLKESISISYLITATVDGCYSKNTATLTIIVVPRTDPGLSLFNLITESVEDQTITHLNVFEKMMFSASSAIPSFNPANVKYIVEFVEGDAVLNTLFQPEIGGEWTPQASGLVGSGVYRAIPIYENYEGISSIFRMTITPENFPVVVDYELDMNARSLTLIFDRELDEASATNCWNYTTDKAYNIYICNALNLEKDIALSDDNKQVTIWVQDYYMEYDEAFSLYVSNIEDLDGNIMSDEQSIDIVCPSVPITKVSTIAELKAKNNGLYRLTGEAVVTATSGSMKWLQDETGAMLIQTTSELMVGNKVTNISGSLSKISEIGPVFYPKEAISVISSDNAIPSPIDVTISDFDNTAFMEAHNCELVKLSGIRFAEADGEKVFGNDYSTYTLTDGTSTKILINYVLFYGIRGQVIPSGIFNITGMLMTTYITINPPYMTKYYLITPFSPDDIQPVNDIAADKVDAPIVSVSPNPTAGILSIKGELEDVKIEVYSQMGTLIGSYASTTPETTIDISHLPAGIYFVKAGTTIAKTIKQ